LPTGGAAVTVADSGLGIPQDALARIFDEFYQIRNPERDHNKGSGLGLAICKRLVEALGCTLSVESNIGVGTIFTLKIPEHILVTSAETRSELSFAGGPDQVAGSAAAPLSGITILLVEDHEVTRKAAARLLAGKGATVLQAATGRDAFEILASGRPQALLLDLMLPDVDGTDILRFLSTRRPASLKCILAVSGDVRDARIAEVKSLGADDLIPKPLDIGQLLSALTSRFHGNPPTIGVTQAGTARGLVNKEI
jgi:CheY-like chemotaxis protein